MTSLHRFITIEGGEGAGKSTLISSLEKKLRECGEVVCVTREPGGTPLAEDLRAVLLNGSERHGDLSADTEALILSAARRDHVDQLIWPELEKNHWVICDRFTDSTRAYQGASLSVDTLNSLEIIATGGLKPGLTLLLDASPEDLMNRRRQRGETTDRFEARGLDFHVAVRKAFLSVAEQFPERIAVLDALQSPEQLAENAWAVIESRFGSELSAIDAQDIAGS